MHVLCVDVVFSLHIERGLCKSPWASGLHLTRRGATHRIVGGVPANLTNRALRIVRMQVSLPASLHIGACAPHPGRMLTDVGGAGFEVVSQGSEQ
jgi:hypothetical protein